MKLKDFNLLRVPLSKDSPFHYNILIKENTSTETDQFPVEKTLFVVHSDPTLTKFQLNQFFSHYGEVNYVVQNINFRNGWQSEKRHKPQALIYIVFKESETLHKVIKHSESLKEKSNVLSLAGAHLKSNFPNIKKWLDNELKMQRPPEIIQKEVDNFMKKFDNKRQLGKQSSRNVPDSDGFIRIRPGHTLRTPDGLVVHSAPKVHRDGKSLPFLKDHFSGINSRKKKKRSKIVDDFYRFQFRENKREELEDLRKQIKKDEDKILEMKQARKFII